MTGNYCDFFWQSENDSDCKKRYKSKHRSVIPRLLYGKQYRLS
jgi:hypothetical protein